MKRLAFIASLLLASTALAQTPAPEAPKPPEAAPAPAPAAPAAAPAPAPKTPFTFAMKGFVSMSASYQSGTFGGGSGAQEGQLSNYATTAAGLADTASTNFDVRQSRFNFSVKGPQVLNGATPAGILEIDWMGGAGAGVNGLASVATRLRLALVELDWGANKLQFGQQNDLIFAMAPTSLSHIGQPLGYATGNSGWRRPGIFGYHTLGLSPDLKTELAWEVGRGNWDDTKNTAGITYAEASAMPALEGRAALSYGKLLWVWVAAHYHQVDLTGVGANPPLAGGPGNHVLPVTSYNAGLKFVYPLSEAMSLTLQGTGFQSTNGSPLIVDFQSFRVGTSTATTAVSANVHTVGWWAQAGFNLTKEFSLWAFYGGQKIDEADFVRAGAPASAPYQNTTTNLMAMYREGGIGFSLEWINFQTKQGLTYDTAAYSILTNRTAKADQVMFTTNYFF